jgi:hypothetical protein
MTHRFQSWDAKTELRGSQCSDGKRGGRQQLGELEEVTKEAAPQCATFHTETGRSL